MLHNGFLLLGTYLTLLAHVHSLVLVSANIGDLKRLAQKFIPQVIVENIADLIYKATEDLAATNVYKENEQNYNHKKKYSRQKESEDSKDIEHAQSISDEVTREPSILSMNSILLAISSQGFNEKRNKATNDKKPKRNNDDVDPKSKTLHHRKKTKSPKLLINKKAQNDESELSEELTNIDSKPFTSSIDLFRDQKKSYDNRSEEFNRYSDEDSQSDIVIETKPKRSKSKAEKAKTKREHANKASLKQNRVKPKRKHSKNDDSEDIKEYTMTTSIERNEFDQYVNLNYPKSKLVATSRPLALTKVKFFDS